MMTKKEYKFEKGMRFTAIQTPITKKYLEIKLGDKLVASLKRTNILRNTFLLEGQWGDWEFYRESIWKSDISIRPYGFDLPTAFFNKKFLKTAGTLKLQMGLQFFIQMHPFKKYHELILDNDRLILYKQKIGLIKRSVEIIVEKENHKINENPWVVAFPLYLIQASKNNFYYGG